MVLRRVLYGDRMDDCRCRTVIRRVCYTNLMTPILDHLRAYLPGQTLEVALDTGGRDKPTLVFLHGIAATSRTWLPVEHELDYTKYRVIALDLLGFGDSPRPRGATYTPDEHAAYVRRTLLRLRVAMPVTLVGHSMGSIISVHYAYRWPAEVARMVLVSLPLYINDASAPRGVTMWTDVYLNAYKFFRSHPQFTIGGAQTMRNLLRLADGIDVTEHDWDAFRLSLRNTIEHQHTYAELQHQSIPTTLIVGTQDEFVVTPALTLAAKMPHITLQKISGSDHVVGDKLARAIVTALER